MNKIKRKILAGVTAFTLSAEVFSVMPANVWAASGDTKSYEKDGYTVTYSVNSEWDNYQTVQVKIDNTGEDSIINWALKYDLGGTVSDIWNSYLYADENDYDIIKNNGYNYEILPGDSVMFGYTLFTEDYKLPEDIEICSRRIDVLSGYTVDFEVVSDWHTGFNGEITINNTSTEAIEAWTLAFDANYDITNMWNAKMLSEEGNSYEAANQLWTTPIQPGESASFGFTAEKSATENALTENYQLTAVVVGDTTLDDTNGNNTGDIDDIDYELDTDGDSLPDYYEELSGTDKNLSDTDGDGLSDGNEIFYIGTDPLKPDTDDNGIIDADEDPDNDSLSNIKETAVGTDINNADTDDDRFNDGDELNIYGTDPLKFDTDSDGISDGDEITLELDPNNGSTNGTPDNERTFTQFVNADSEVLSAVNKDEETPFDVSLEIKAAGVAENNVYARESGYSNVIENTAIIGMAPEFVYTEGLAVEEVTVKFELDDSILNNTLGTYTASSREFEGIKRLNVFMFFEEVNMLLPVETFHDETTNTVYTKTDRMGTYCLVDMEIFLDNLEIKSSSAKVNAVEAYSANTHKLYCAEVSKSTAFAENKDGFDVVFLIDSRTGSSTEDYAEIQKNIIETADYVFSKSPNARVRLVELFQMSNNEGSTTYKPVYRMAISDYEDPMGIAFYNTEEVTLALGKITEECEGTHQVSCLISDAVKYIYNSTYNREIYVYCILQQEKIFYRGGEEDSYYYLNDIKNTKKSIDISTLFDGLPEHNVWGYALDLADYTKGIVFPQYNDSANVMLSHIYGKYDDNQLRVITATGFKKVVLESSLQQNYEWYKTDKFSPGQVKGVSDTDDDGLYDFEEIMFEYSNVNGIMTDTVKIDENGKASLYTFGQIRSRLNSMIAVEEKLFYVENGLKRYTKATGEDYLTEIASLENVCILPIRSDPTDGDGDRDEIPDNLDDNPLISNDYPSLFKSMIINQIVDFDEIAYINSDNMMCTVSLDKVYNHIDITQLECYNKLGSIDDLSIIKESLNSYYLIASGMGDEAMYFAAQWNDMSVIKHIILINQTDKARKYTDANFDDLRSEYPIYDLTVEIAENAQKWLEAVEETDDFYISNINEYIDNSETSFQVVYKVTNNELFNSLDSTYKNAGKGFYAAAYHSSDFVTKLPATVLMLPKSYIESDYLYRNEFEEKFGYRPLKYSGISRSLFTIDTVSDMGIYFLDDFENKVFLGTDADREQYLGGVLFELCATLATVEASKLLDDASVKVKADEADEFLEIIEKSDSELTPDELAYKQAYNKSKSLDDIADKIDDTDNLDNTPTVTYDIKSGNNFISYKNFSEVPITKSVEELFDEYCNLPSKTKKDTGYYGEKIAKKMLEDNGWTILKDIKNNSNNGIDIVAQGPNGQVGFFEVKASSSGKIPDLSKDSSFSVGQIHPKEFIEERLTRAKSGAYKNHNAQITAEALYNDLFKGYPTGDYNYNYNVTASTITIDFSEDKISVVKW